MRLIGESRLSLHTAIGAVLPTLLSALSRVSITRNGNQLLHGMLNHAALDHAMDWAALKVDDDHYSAVTRSGEQFIGALFGERASGLAIALAALAEIKPANAHRLLSLSAPLVMTLLRARLGTTPLAIEQLRALLAQHRDAIAAMVPERMKAALGPEPATPGAQDSNGPAAPTKRVERAALIRSVPWMVVALAAIILLPQLRGCISAKHVPIEKSKTSLLDR